MRFINLWTFEFVSLLLATELTGLLATSPPCSNIVILWFCLLWTGTPAYKIRQVSFRYTLVPTLESDLINSVKYDLGSVDVFCVPLFCSSPSPLGFVPPVVDSLEVPSACSSWVWACRELVVWGSFSWSFKKIWKYTLSFCKNCW